MSITARRRCPRRTPAGGSDQTPASSGPRWARRASIRSRRSSASASPAGSESRIPAIPHTVLSGTWRSVRGEWYRRVARAGALEDTERRSEPLRSLWCRGAIASMEHREREQEAQEQQERTLIQEVVAEDPLDHDDAHENQPG